MTSLRYVPWGDRRHVIEQSHSRQTVASVDPSSLNSTPRNGASATEKNSSSCGGGADVAAEHRVRLATMMDLVLEQMQQKAVRTLLLHACAAVYVNNPIGGGFVQHLAPLVQPAGGAYSEPARDAGLRIDHLLLSPPLAKRLTVAGVDREV